MATKRTNYWGNEEFIGFVWYHTGGNAGQWTAKYYCVLIGTWASKPWTICYKGRWRNPGAGSVHVTVLPKEISSRFTVLSLPLTNLAWYYIASANEIFVRSFMKKMGMASKSLIHGHVSLPTPTPTNSRKTYAERTRQVNVTLLLLSLL